jgi:hypothetical protein
MFDAKFAWVAQLVEHFPEEEGVGGSSPPPSTKYKKPRKGSFCIWCLGRKTLVCLSGGLEATELIFWSLSSDKICEWPTKNVSRFVNVMKQIATILGRAPARKAELCCVSELETCAEPAHLLNIGSSPSSKSAGSPI